MDLISLMIVLDVAVVLKTDFIVLKESNCLHIRQHKYDYAILVKQRIYNIEGERETHNRVYYCLTTYYCYSIKRGQANMKLITFQHRE